MNFNFHYNLKTNEECVNERKGSHGSIIFSNDVLPGRIFKNIKLIYHASSFSFICFIFQFWIKSRYSRENGNSIPQALTKRYSKGKNRKATAFATWIIELPALLLLLSDFRCVMRTSLIHFLTISFSSTPIVKWTFFSVQVGQGICLNLCDNELPLRKMWVICVSISYLSSSSKDFFHLMYNFLQLSPLIRSF